MQSIQWCKQNFVILYCLPACSSSKFGRVNIFLWCLWRSWRSVFALWFLYNICQFITNIIRFVYSMFLCSVFFQTLCVVSKEVFLLSLHYQISLICLSFNFYKWKVFKLFETCLLFFHLLVYMINWKFLYSHSKMGALREEYQMLYYMWCLIFSFFIE